MELEPHHATVVCYEIVLGASATWDGFLREQIPRLTEHLASKGLPILGGPSVVVSIWRGDQMFMFTSPRLFEIISDIESMSRDELLRRIEDWRVGIGLPSVPLEHGEARSLSEVAWGGDTARFAEQVAGAVPRERSLALPSTRESDKGTSSAGEDE